VFSSARIVGSGVIPLLLAIFTVINARNAMALIKLNITGKWCGVIRQTNPPRLETKKGEPCTHSFKYINCKGKHQVDSSSCPFWKHRFNRTWYMKKS